VTEGSCWVRQPFDVYVDFITRKKYESRTCYLCNGNSPSPMKRFVKSHKAVIQVFPAVKNVEGTITKEDVDRPEYGFFNLCSCKLWFFNALLSNFQCLSILNFGRIFKDYWKCEAGVNKRTCMYLVQIHECNIFYIIFGC
jgi:hypothetical protein